LKSVLEDVYTVSTKENKLSVSIPNRLYEISC